MKIDKLTTLAFSMYSNKGAYALLLGSGVSRAAHISTAWEIESDLISKVAAIKGVTDEEDWHEWYKNEYGEKANYSDLLDNLTKTSTERVHLLKDYFEPSDEDKELGWKQPTAAHRAIAKLAKAGYVKVIVTTNFDRLIETALQEEGITPQTVYHVSNLQQITPLPHSDRPTVIKVNGDYIDCQFRNTTEELDEYPPEIERFLKRIFEVYGLITCGWSAKWDNGLIRMIKGAGLSRYGMFLTERGDPSEVQKELTENRNGELLNIKDADSFFTELSEQVFALENINLSRALSHDVIMARVEKYLSSSQYDIMYTKLVEDLTNSAYEKIMAEANYSFVLDNELFSKYDSLHYEAVKPLIDIIIRVARWGKSKHFRPISDAMIKLCTLPLSYFYGSRDKTRYVHRLAASFLFYAYGVACVKYERFDELDKIFRLKVPKENFFYHHRMSLAHVLAPNCEWGDDKWREFTGINKYDPHSFYYMDALKPHFKPLFSSESEYIEYYCIWETLMSLLYGYYQCDHLMPDSFTMGFFIYARAEYDQRELRNNAYFDFWTAADKEKDKWTPIAQGLFGGKYVNYAEIRSNAEEYYKQYYRRR